VNVTDLLPAPTANVSRNVGIALDLQAEIEKDLNWPLRERFEQDFFGGPRSDDDVRASVAKRFLPYAAERCDGWRDGGSCEYVFQTGDKVGRWRSGGLGRWELVTRCAECANIGAATKGEPCEGGCGLLVVSFFRFDRRRWHHSEYRTCSKRCTEIAAKRRRRHATTSERSCETCGETFAPPRSDGRYCSNACRQKAYRKRKEPA